MYNSVEVRDGRTLWRLVDGLHQKHFKGFGLYTLNLIREKRWDIVLLWFLLIVMLSFYML
jgi:hypothetical protein